MTGIERVRVSARGHVNSHAYPRVNLEISAEGIKYEGIPSILCFWLEPLLHLVGIDMDRVGFVERGSVRSVRIGELGGVIIDLSDENRPFRRIVMRFISKKKLVLPLYEFGYPLSEKLEKLAKAALAERESED